MSIKKASKEQLIEAARLRVERALRELKANEILWEDRWKSAANPFEAINDWCSAEQRQIRKPYIKAWLSAVGALNALKAKKTAKEGATRVNPYSDSGRSTGPTKSEIAPR